MNNNQSISLIKNLSAVDKLSLLSLCGCIAILLLFNGGFNNVICILLSAVLSLMAIYVLFKYKKQRSTSVSSILIIGWLIVLCLSAICNNITITEVIQIFSLLSLLSFIILFSYSNKNIKKLIYWFIIFIGIIFSLFGIIIYLFLPNNLSLVFNGRLMFPFQYANTSGLWFCIVTVLCWSTKNWKFRIASVSAIVACFLTKSAGAIGIMFVVSIIYLIAWFKIEVHKQEFNVMAIVIYGVVIVGVAIFGMLNVDRFFESSQTFIERFIQMSDGVSLWLTSPLFGIGPDQWQFIYPYVQSAQYTASKIHNSYLQILLDGGIFALVIFLAFIIYSILRLIKAKNWTYLICSCIILIHAFFDFDLSFPLILLLLFMFLDTELKHGNKAFNIVLATMTFVGCCFGMYFNMQLNSVINLPKNTDKASMFNLYEYPDYILNDVKASTYLTITLANSERYEEAIMLTNDTFYSSSTQQYYAFHSIIKLGKIDEANLYLNEILTNQPYNVDLFEKISEYLTNEYHEQQLIDTYNKYVINSNLLIKHPPASFLSAQKTFDLIK